MPEIGASLREARMRQRIDISEVEAETKIRAKYLRALENEEWNLLPGPTYVKSFLRTYADAVGLDGRLLVEEYKLRHERLSDIELQPIAPPSARDRDRRRGRPSGGVPRGWLVGVVVAGLLVALYAIGRRDDPEPSSGPARSTQQGRQPATDAPTEAERDERRRREAEERRLARLVRLQIVPTGPVYVCLEAAGGRRLVNGLILQPGTEQPTYRSSRFRVTLGNSQVTLRIDGRARPVPEVASGIAYEITRRGRRALPGDDWPSCT
jgi:hypothetical protein